ncbi:MAG: NAD(P)/FAD-dependent oxidoreductase [Haloarcula sp.]
MRIAVLGAGYAGLTLARTLERTLPEAVELVVVNEQGTHLVQHELHRVVRQPSLAAEITVDLESVLDCEIRQATVTDVDPDKGTAILAGSETLSYDVGAVCLGARTAYYGLPGVREHATPLKRLDDAHEIRERFLELGDGDRVVIGGAGLSGVQIAGELAEMRDADIEVLLLEQEPAVVPSFPASFQTAVHDALVDVGVTVRTETGVAGGDAGSVTLDDGSELGADQFIWTGGIEGSPALDADRPVVRADLRLGESTFAVGDAARVVDSDGTAVPASASAAIREARVAADNIQSLVDHRRAGDDSFQPRLAQYQFNVPGWLVSVGDDAVAKVGPSIVTGRAALALKTTIGAGYLGTVGAIENAVDLVREELELDDGDVAGQ